MVAGAFADLERNLERDAAVFDAVLNNGMVEGLRAGEAHFGL